MKSLVIQATRASSAASLSAVPSTGMLFETGSKLMNALYTARLALWRERTIFCSAKEDGTSFEVVWIRLIMI